MNERIKAFWDQAANAASPESWASGTDFVEKFAELIVKDCIGVVENMPPGYKDYRDQIEDAFRRDCIELMKERFGVNDEPGI